MITITNPKGIKAIRREAFLQNRSIGFVPTMGNLHTGHFSLLEKSRAENDISILSIFINPTQFNNPDDLTHYPKTLDNDKIIAEKADADYLFLPDEKTMYPDHYQFKITENKISRIVEGQHRPGHFDGVLTVMMKLLQIVKPNRTYLGEKDYQQYQLIKELADAFFLDTQIIGCPTIREPNGLAFSSRNNHLSEKKREFAATFYQVLSSPLDCQAISKKLTALGFEVDYIEDFQQRRYGAVYLDGVRLIDNIPI